jgi:diketogulonate reductase-like aldo/keto reductase
LLHFPVTELRRPAWRKMEELCKSGRAKAIGVSNYTIAHLEELLAECTVPPAVNQVELHVFLQQPELVKFCQAHNIVVEAYSPLAHGERLDDPVLAAIASKHDKTPVQVMIRWCLEIGTVPLPKSATPERIAQNLDVFDFELDSDDMAKIKSLESDFRTAWDPTHVA